MDIEILEKIMWDGYADVVCTNSDCGHDARVEPDASYECYECRKRVDQIKAWRFGSPGERVKYSEACNTLGAFRVGRLVSPLRAAGMI